MYVSPNILPLCYKVGINGHRLPADSCHHRTVCACRTLVNIGTLKKINYWCQICFRRIILPQCFEQQNSASSDNNQQKDCCNCNKELGVTSPNGFLNYGRFSLLDIVHRKKVWAFTDISKISLKFSPDIALIPRFL